MGPENTAGLTGVRKSWDLMPQLAIGSLAALVAVGIRYVLPLRPEQLPTATVVVTLALVTTFIGFGAGLAVAVIGGALSWYLFLNPSSWSLANGAWVTMLGYVIVAVVILITSHLYRSSERLHNAREFARLQAHAETAELFARELAHRLGNTLAIVQSVAVQTLGKDAPEAQKLVGRLRALATANQLLTEHVDTPTAQVMQVVKAALEPFGESDRFAIGGIDAPIPSQDVLTLSMAIHELATNAMKYGALATPGGSVSIAIENGGARLTMTWRERGGPKVRPPDGQGFGTKLLSRNGTTLQFQPEGLVCSIMVRKAEAAVAATIA